MSALMSDLLRPVLDQISKLWGRVDQMPVVRWGTVTAASPLRVVLDGNTDPLPFAPQSLVRTLQVGNRVLCIEQHRRVIVVDLAGNPVEWMTPTLTGGFTLASAPLQLRVTPTRVEFAGGILRTTTPSAYTTAFTLPANVPRPRGQYRAPGRDDFGMWVAMLSTGDVQMKATGAATSGAGYTFDGMSYAY